MPLNNLKENELREYCKSKVESLENWLRRLVHEELTKAYGAGYISSTNSNGDSLIKKSIVTELTERNTNRPGRYPRVIDAALLDNLIDIICNPILFKSHFKEAMSEAFPLGNVEARFFLEKIKNPRNHLSHANPISVRQAEQVICYCNDIIDSIKAYYKREGQQLQYNVPSILKFIDSFGNIGNRNVGAEKENYNLKKGEKFLYPGDILSIEVEVDPSFPEETYDITWNVYVEEILRYVGNRLVINIERKHIAESFLIECLVTSKEDWHRYNSYDDKISFLYKVLPVRQKA